MNSIKQQIKDDVSLSIREIAARLFYLSEYLTPNEFWLTRINFSVSIVALADTMRDFLQTYEFD